MSSQYTTKLHPGSKFPHLTATLLTGDIVELGKPTNGLAASVDLSGSSLPSLH